MMKIFGLFLIGVLHVVPRCLYLFGGAAIPKPARMAMRGKSGAVGAFATTAIKKLRYRFSPSPLTRIRLSSSSCTLPRRGRMQGI